MSAKSTSTAAKCLKLEVAVTRSTLINGAIHDSVALFGGIKEIAAAKLDKKLAKKLVQIEKEGLVAAKQEYVQAGLQGCCLPIKPRHRSFSSCPISSLCWAYDVTESTRMSKSQYEQFKALQLEQEKVNHPSFRSSIHTAPDIQ